MDFETYVHLIYIKGFFRSQYTFVLELLKSSVETPAKISISESALKGYIGGDPIHTLADTLVDAGISQDRIATHLQSLYELSHKDTPTFIARYHGQTYQEALYEQIQKDKHSQKALPEITMDNMAEILAQAFFNLIQATANPVRVDKRRKQPQNDIVLDGTAGTGTISQIIDEIDACLTEMIVIGRADAESQEKYIGFRASQNPVLHRMLAHLREKASELLACGPHQSVDTVNQLFVAIQEITEADFILTEPDFVILSSRNIRLHQLLALVEKLKTESASQL